MNGVGSWTIVANFNRVAMKMKDEETYKDARNVSEIFDLLYIYLKFSLQVLLLR